MNRAIAALLLAAACTQPPAATTTPWDRAQDAEAIMRPTTLGQAFASLAAPQARYATVYVGPSSGCALQVGGPVVVGGGHPIAGKLFRYEWQVEAVDPPAAAVSLLVSLRDLPQPIVLGAAAPGCRLFVHPDYILTPAPGGLLTYTPGNGVVALNWTPPVDLVGTIFRTQLLVARPNANGLGHLLSAPVHFDIGTK
jgi:hypothetical protein